MTDAPDLDALAEKAARETYDYFKSLGVGWKSDGERHLVVGCMAHAARRALEMRDE